MTLLDALVLIIGGMVSLILAAADVASLATILAAITGAGGLGSFFTWRATAKKSTAETESISVATMRGVMDELREQLKSEREWSAAALAEKDRQIAALRERVAVLESRAGIRS